MADALDPAMQKSIDKFSHDMNLSEKQAKALEKAWVKSMKSVEASFAKATRSVGTFNSKIAETEKTVDNLDDEVNKLMFEKKLPVERAAKFKKELDDIDDELASIKKKKGPLDATDLQNQIDHVEALNKKLGKMEMATKGAAKISQETFEHLGSGAASVGDMFSAIGRKSPRDLKAASAAASQVGEDISVWGTKLSGMGGAFSKMGPMVKGLGTKLGGISKILGGWPGLILMAVKAAVDFVMEADQFVKDQNKIFAQMRGPDIMTKDVEKQFKDFNDQIFDAAANIKVGFNAKQIQEFFATLAQGGVNITNLNRGLTNYRDAVYVAAKASKSLGMDLPYVGAQMADLITNFKANLDEVDRAFIEVAFDAGKSGLSTDRFWTAVKNATAGMAMYGLFIKAASKTMKAFTESQVMGAEDAAKGTEEMYDVFKKGSLKSRMAVIQFAGGISDEFTDYLETLKNKKAEIQAQIDVLPETEENTEELQKLRKEMAANNAQIVDVQKAAAGDQLAQANNLAMISDKAPSILIRALEKQFGSLNKAQGESYTVLMQAVEKFGVSADLAEKLVRTTQGTGKYLENMADDLTKVDDLASYSKKNVGYSKDLDRLAKLDKRIQTAIQNNDKAGLAKLLKSDNVIRKMTKSNFEDDGLNQQAMADAADNTLGEVNKQTLSYKEMIDIAKDEVKWRLNSLGVFRSINSSVNDILALINTKGKKTESQKIAESNIKAMFKADKTAATASGYTGGDITSMVVTKSAKYFGDQIGKLEKKVAAAGGVKKSITGAEDLSAASQMLTEQAKTAMASGDQETANKAMEKAAKLDKAQLKLSKSAKMSDKERNALIKMSLKDAATFNDDQIKKFQDEIGVDKQNLETLKNVDHTAVDIADYQKLLALSTPEGSQGIMDKLTENIKQGDSLSAAVEKSGIDPSVILSKIRTDKNQYGFSKEQVKNLESYVAKAQLVASGPKSSVGFATTSKPVSISSPGVAKLHPGDTIMGGNMAPKVVPAHLPNVTPNSPIPGAGKSLSINVTATEKDLAQRIANEVRSVLFKESYSSQ